VIAKQKKQLQKNHEIAIATKKTVEKHTGKKVWLQKNQLKKAPCHDCQIATRLVFA
jgi:hypothetical protein